ncbi:MAG: GNAT family N-acetyltransferase [Calditrichaeota bacterium]|nr:MAG: GNAT family N-acetyltransferase [Calditrichota bacterium]
MNIYNDAGELIFGTRLKRLSERFLISINRIYKTLDIPFEPAWFPMFFILYKYGPKSVTEIAELLDITHSAISQQATVLERKKLVQFVPSETDKRKRLLKFTTKGQKLINQVLPVWQSIKRNMRRMLDENPNSGNVLQALSEIEEISADKDIYTRVLQDLREHHFTIMDILPYSPHYEKEYKSLIFDWFIDNTETDVENQEFLNDPMAVIERKAGQITLAKPEQEIVGTVACKYHGNTHAEVLFLIVKADWRQRQIGRILLMDVLKNLRQLGFKKVTARADRKHIAALKVLRFCGFELQEMHAGNDQTLSDKTILEFSINLLVDHEIR